MEKKNYNNSNVLRWDSLLVTFVWIGGGYPHLSFELRERLGIHQWDSNPSTKYYKKNTLIGEYTCSRIKYVGDYTM